MKTFKIYTAGQMSGLSYDEQMGWRLELERLVRTISNNVLFIHPPHYYRYGDGMHQTEREAMVWDLSQIRDSDIVVVNLENISKTVGTHMELGFIEAVNQMSTKHLHLIGVGKPDVEHPWLNEVLLRREDTLEKAAAYISAYLLV